MGRGGVVQGGIRADKVIEEDEQGNEVVGGGKRGKKPLDFVPSLELLLNQVVGNVIVEALHADMANPCNVLTGTR